MSDHNTASLYYLPQRKHYLDFKHDQVGWPSSVYLLNHEHRLY